MQETIKSYIAGFLDGDGSIYVRVKKNNTHKYGFQILPAIVFFQKDTNVKVLHYLHDNLSFGYIRTRNDKMCEYVIGNINEIQKVINLIQDYVVLKKPQLLLLQELINKKSIMKYPKDFLELVKIADEISKKNYSSVKKAKSDIVFEHFVKLKLL